MTLAYDLSEPYAPEPVADRGELELNTALYRRFLGIAEDEPVEVTAWRGKQIHVGYATSERHHVDLLRQAQQIRGCMGVYTLVNGPFTAEILARYEPNRMHYCDNQRVKDKDIARVRSIYIDVDPIRIPGISSTDEQLREAWEVSRTVEAYLADELGDDSPIGHGCSGNGYFTLIALEPVESTPETYERISRFLDLLQAKFGTATVKIDTSVATPARLMPAPGTWKRKGWSTPERPHRMTSFCCRPAVRRIRLDDIA